MKLTKICHKNRGEVLTSWSFDLMLHPETVLKIKEIKAFDVLSFPKTWLYTEGNGTFLSTSGIYEAVKDKQNHKTKKSNPLTNSGPSYIPIPSPFLTETSMIRFSKLDVAMDKLTSLTVKRNLSKYLYV